MPRFPSFERKSPVSEFGAAGRDGPDGSRHLAGQNGQARRMLDRPGGCWAGQAGAGRLGGSGGGGWNEKTGWGVEGLR